MNPLEARLGYKFRNSLLLAEALTHPSLAYESKRSHFDYQRLEFLGDAVLQLILTERLFTLFHDQPEGRLTKLRTRIVSRAAMAELGAQLDLGSFLMMGRGEELCGGRERASNLSDAFESLMGAIYLDSSFDTVKEIVLRLAADMVERLAAQPLEQNPKGELQEILQEIGPRGPSYFVISEQGPEHLKAFVSIVMWEGLELGRGSGRSKKESEINAAQNALEQRLWTGR